MTTLASSTGSLHRDIRSGAQAYKRDKEHSAKWTEGVRPLHGVRYDIFSGEPVTGSLEQQAKVRPAKKIVYPSKHHSNTLRSSWQTGNASGRIARKAEAHAEVTSPNTLSRSIAELAPHNSPTKASRTSSLEPGVLYSFDAKASPRRGVGLNALVEKAELEWSNKETMKLVKKEYEILDESGEIAVMKEKKKGKKSSPKQRPQLILAEEEDDWERI